MTLSDLSDGDPLVQRLRLLALQAPDLKEAARLYEIILPLLRDAELLVTPVSLTPEEVRAKLVRGVPLLTDIELEIDHRQARELMLRLVIALEAAGGTSRSKYQRIRRALEEERLDVSELLAFGAAGEETAITSLARRLRLDLGLITTLARNVFKPALRSWCRQLAPLVRGKPWNHGYCFLCSAGALLGELQDNQLSKHLRCGQCGADWPFSRLQCTYCGNADHRTLSYLYWESQREKMWVEVCDNCKGYLKVIVSFAPTAPDALSVEDLATLHLDTMAKERGYRRIPLASKACSS